MRKSISLLLMGILLSSGVLTSYETPFANAQKPSKYALDTLLVKFKDSANNNDRQELLEQNQAMLLDEISQIKVHVIKVPEKNLEKVELNLQNNPKVEYVERDYLLEPNLIPNDPYYSNQWYLPNVTVEKAWDITKGDSKPIAVLDSGIDQNHPDLSSKIQDGWNFYDDTSDITDTCKHGTRVAGVVGAVTNNDVGISGVAWSNPIMPIKITDGQCYGHSSAMIKGIVYAADRGAVAANISYGIYNGDAVKDAAQYMHSKGGWVVVSGGNNGEHYWGVEDNPYVISVSATDSNNSITSWSTSGPYIDFAAPGSKILTTNPGGDYVYSSGTSFSAPITAGAIALISATDSSLTSDQIYNKLKDSVLDLGSEGRDDSYGWGKIDVAAAIQTPADPIDNPDTDIDDVPPNVEILNPDDGAKVNGKTIVSISASDDVQLSIVNLFINGELITSSNSSFDYDWNTNKYGSGTHSVMATAQDKEGNTSEISISVITEKGGGGDKENPGKKNGKNK